MPPLTKEEIFDPAFLASLSHLRIVARRVPRDGRFAEQRSHDLGHGTDFRDFRPYAPGDDFRAIDWNIYQRLGRVFLRLYEELEDLPLYLMPDTSRSLFLESPPRALACLRTTLALASISLNHHDSTGLFPFSDDCEILARPQSGRGKVMLFADRLAHLEPGGQTDIGAAIKRFNSYGLRRGLLVVVSDFFDPAGAKAVTAALKQVRHKLLLVQLHRRSDAEPDVSGDVRLIDCESREAEDVSVTPTLVKRYRQVYEQFQADIAEFAKSRNAGLLRIDVDEEIVPQLANVFEAGEVHGMSLQNLGAAPFLLGLAVIAGLLFLLQRLRVKFSEREVVTTLFWKQAVEETRARMLMRRFRHPLAYLLALAIAGLVWLAIAEPDRNRGDETDYVFLLDGSAGMDWGDRFERAKTLLRQEADRLPAARRRIYFCGADSRLILDRREETSLLLPRLAELAPEACPSSIEREMLALASDGTSTGNIRLLVVGDAPVSEDGLAVLPDNASVERLRSEQTPRLENNAGIAAIGVADAASGAFDRVDVMVGIAGAPDAAITIKLGDKPLSQAPTREEGGYLLRDLPARGEVLEIALAAEDPLAIDDRARITLPTRSTIAVSVDENLDPRFHALVDADPALVPDSGAPEVVIGGMADGSLPAIELVTGNGIAVIYEEGLAPPDIENLQNRFSDTGLDRVGWNLGPGPDRTGGFGLSPRFVPGPEPKVQVGIELIGSDYDFMQTSAFPLFLSTAIRWLAGVEPVEPFAVAGERAAHAGTFTLAGSDYAPPRAGRLSNRDGDEIEVALAAVPAMKNDALKQVARSTERGPWPGVFTCCILVALLLVGGEWWAFQKGRMP